ncbi:MAG: FAD-dependent oxidoreductase, partial [Spirochaetia bacterium]|nr:FAD-dependent oxidoreductase [Spirochaetia bacterium]
KVSALKVQRMKAGPVDSSGRPTPVPTNEFYEIPCDSIIVAIGEKVQIPGLEDLDIQMQRDGRLKVDPYSLRSANSKLFACGDAVMGPATAAEAMGQARVVSEVLDEALSGQKRFFKLFRHFEYKMEVPTKLTKAKMTRAIFIPVDARKNNFMEISLGYTGEQARIEAERCLRCDVRDRKRETYSAPVQE